MKTDMLDVVGAALEAAGYDPCFKRLDEFTGPEGVVVRQMIPTVLSTDMCGTKDVLAPYVVLVRSRSELNAMETCWGIAELLGAADLPSRDGSYRFTASVVQSEPASVALEEDDIHGWAVTMAVRMETD